MPADAQHHASKQKAQTPKSDAQLIASATSAAPSAVTKDATIVAVGSDGNGRYARVRAHLPAFPMIQTLRETTRCAWTEMASNGSKQC